MLLEPRTRLGPYEVLAPAGAGGMGEVYRALDTRLGRHVAVKVLPAPVANDAEWRQRLDREARAISSLSHPNICALYDVGHEAGVDFLVMEYLEGETLAARLQRGALPADQVIRYGIEIADALQGAHRKGIVHRDLKPSNIMLTRTGARLLDFGLAKPVVPLTAAGATVSAPLTTKGTLLGTFQYMSPEQLEGKEADARSDIFALGCVLYETATGVRAFEGETPASVIAAILEREPPTISRLQPLMPPALDDIVRGCLAKDPEERWQTAHDVRLQLQALRDRSRQPVADALPARVSRREMVAWTLAILSLLGLAALGLLSRPSRVAQPAAPLRAFLLAPSGHSFTRHDFAISPDGRHVAFVATGPDSIRTLWVHALDSSSPAEISGSAGAMSPFWSADSQWIGFFVGTKLMKVEAGGTRMQTICETISGVRYGAWNAQDVILFSNSVVGPLFRVSAGGGTATPVTSIPEDSLGEAHRFPQFLPDGKRFLYVKSWTSQQHGGLYLASLDGGGPELVSADIRSRVVLLNGYLLFVRGGTVFAQPFDMGSGRLTGAPQAIVLNEVVSDWRFGEVPLTGSLNGTLLFQSRLRYNTQLVWYDRSGREEGVVGSPGFMAPALSPDGRHVAVAFDSTGTGQQNIWIHDLQRNISTPLTTTGTDTAHTWSADGRWLIYSSIRGANGIYRRLANGSASEENLIESPAHLLVNSVSSDGRYVLYMDFADGFTKLQRYDLEAKRSEPVESGAEAGYSPDGKWITYVGQPSFMLLVKPAAEDGGRIQISSGPGFQARWRRDGKEIFYVAPDKKIMAVPVSTVNGTLEPGRPAPLFQTRIIQPVLVLFQWDVTADGKRFLINSLPREDAAAPLTLLTNWTAELKH
jgi:eukaryotic-like serine/threonine-protein kinase